MLRYFSFLPSILLLLIACSASGRELVLATASVDAIALTSTPAMLIVASALDAIRLNPKRYDLQNILAAGLIRRARETGDGSFYTRAAEAVAASLRLDPNNSETVKLLIQVEIGEGNYARALPHAEAISKKAPDDLMAAVYLADIHLALGNYPEAERAAQWALDLRRGNAEALRRGAALREALGDVEGAIDFLTQVIHSIAERDIDERAAIFTQIARLELVSGKLDAAAVSVRQALAIFPNYPDGLRVLAHVQFAAGKFEESADSLAALTSIAPRPECFYDRAEALERAGKHEAAAAMFADFEKRALAVTDEAVNANRELIFYEVDRAGKPAEALRLASREMERRHDLATRDAYAWALYGSGDIIGAKKQMDIALAVGARPASLCYHAGAIALKTGDEKAAVDYFRKAIEASGPEAEPARRMLAKTPGR